MTPDEAARALVAHPRWRWHHTMGRVCLDSSPGNLTLLPDLDDPATAGVLLEAVAAEVEGQDLTITYAAPMRAPDERAWTLALSDTIGAGDTLGHAAALALLHIWTETP